MHKELALYVLEQACKISGPHKKVYSFWQPWVQRCEGTQFMDAWGAFTALKYLWVNQDMKAEMTGR